MTTLGGYYFNHGDRLQLHFLKNAEISDVDAAFAKCRNHGVVSLKNYIPGKGDVSLTITCSNLIFMPACGYRTDDDYVFLTLNDFTLPNQLISLLGEKYPERATTKNPSVVRSVYAEFLADKIPSQLSQQNPIMVQPNIVIR